MARPGGAGPPAWGRPEAPAARAYLLVLLLARLPCSLPREEREENALFGGRPRVGPRVSPDDVRPAAVRLDVHVVSEEAGLGRRRGRRQVRHRPGGDPELLERLAVVGRRGEGD